VVSEKMIEDDLNRVEESTTTSMYKLGVAFERCENKAEKSAPKFVPSSNYHKEEKTIKSTKTYYPSNPKPSFNPTREARKEIPKLRDEAFICIFCGHAGHLDELYFHRKRIEKMRLDYVRNRYHNEFIGFPPHTSSHASSRFFHGPNHRSYDFGSRENGFVPIRFSHGPCSHHGDRPPRRHSFPARGSYTRLEPIHFDGPCLPHRGSHPTSLNGEVLKTMKTSSGCMVKCWIPKFYLTNPNTEPSTFSRPL
jgi:hypothetical protein